MNKYHKIYNYIIINNDKNKLSILNKFLLIIFFSEIIFLFKFYYNNKNNYINFFI